MVTGPLTFLPWFSEEQRASLGEAKIAEMKAAKIEIEEGLERLYALVGEPGYHYTFDYESMPTTLQKPDWSKDDHTFIRGQLALMFKWRCTEMVPSWVWVHMEQLRKQLVDVPDDALVWGEAEREAATVRYAAETSATMWQFYVRQDEHRSRLRRPERLVLRRTHGDRSGRAVRVRRAARTRSASSRSARGPDDGPGEPDPATRQPRRGDREQFTRLMLPGRRALVELIGRFRTTPPAHGGVSDAR